MKSSDLDHVASIVSKIHEIAREKENVNQRTWLLVADRFDDDISFPITADLVMQSLQFQQKKLIGELAAYGVDFDELEWSNA